MNATQIKALSIILLLGPICASQSRLHPYLGLHVSGDAQLYYVGPSFSVGTDVTLTNTFSLTGYIHYFPKNVDKTYSNGDFARGRYRSTTAALLGEIFLGKTPEKGMFVAAGVSVQHTKDDFKSSWTTLDQERTIVIPALRVGYMFPISAQKKLALELNATGPYAYKSEDNGYIIHSLEVLTQLSLGSRIRF